MSQLLEALAVMAELTGTDWSKPAIRVIEQELSVYHETDVITAIRKCQGELRHRVTLADILDRIPSQHPGVEEAWGLISKVMNNEQISICWTDQMREAYGVAAPLAEDMVAARMAFKEKYQQLLSEARAVRRMPAWSVSPGWDKTLRAECAQQALQRNLVSQSVAGKMLTYDPPPSEARSLLVDLGVHLGER
jgi:hypothetical protein